MIFDLQNKIDLEAIREFNGTTCTESNRNAFQYGAKFVTGILLFEIEVLKELNIEQLKKMQEMELRINSLDEENDDLLYKNLISRLSSATEKYEHAMIELRSYDQILDEKNKEIQSLKDENKKFREALEFYANGGNSNRDIWFDDDLGYFTGKRARQTLEGVSK